MTLKRYDLFKRAFKAFLGLIRANLAGGLYEPLALRLFIWFRLFGGHGPLLLVIIKRQTKLPRIIKHPSLADRQSSRAGLRRLFLHESFGR
jgi:hypothetical protein